MRKSEIAVVILIALFASIILFFIVKTEIGISWDSVNYIASANYFREGKGFLTPMLRWYENGSIKPLTHYPPLYPFILAIIMSFGLNHIYSAALLNSLLFGLNLLLINYITYRNTNSKIASLLAIFFAICSRPFLGIHFALLSDSLFLFLFLLLSLLFQRHYSYNRFLLLVSIIVALSCLTRYISITLLATVMIIFLISDLPKVKKMIYIFYFFIISFIPLLLWLIRNKIVAHNIFNRSFSYNPILIYKIREGLSTISSWFIPAYLPLYLRIILSAILFILIYVVFFKIYKNSDILKKNIERYYILKKFTIYSSIFILIYIAFLLFSVSFFDEATYFENRILAPVYILIFIIFISWITHILKISYFYNNLFIIVSLIFVCAFFIFNCSYWILNYMKSLPEFVENGFSIPEWNSSIWDSSKLINFIRNQKRDITIFSNAHDLIYLTTKKFSYDLPRKDEIYKLKDFINKVYKLNGIIVYFGDIKGRDYFIERDKLLSAHKNSVILEDKSGLIFVYN